MAICLPQVSKNIWNFDPRSVPGCSLWLDAADASQVTFSSSTNVNTWIDKSGFNNNCSNQSLGSTITYPGTKVNGLNTVNFTAGCIRGAFNSSSVINTTDVTIFIVTVETAPNNNLRMFSLTTAANYQDDTANTMLVYCAPGNYQLTFYRAGAMPTPYTVTQNVPFIYSLTQTSGTGSMWLNGGSNTTASITTSAFAVTNYNIGTQYLANQNYTGLMCEILVYKSLLTTSQRQQVEGYLAHKWGLTSMYSALPSIHPFSSIRPHLRTFQPTDIPGCELWFDGGDNTTMFQNTAGTTPVTAGSQSVACWKDKIRNLSITNTGVPGQSMLAPTSVSGGGVFFNNTSTVVSASAQGLGTSLTGRPTQQNRFLFRMPNKLMTMITASYPLSNNNYRQILCLATDPIGSTPPNFNIGHEIGATNGGTVLFDFNGSNWGQVSVSTSGYNTSTILRIDSLITDANPLWLTNGTANTFTQTNTYTSGNTNYPVNSIAMGGYSSTFVGSRNFHGTIYETVLYSKLLTTSERQQVEGYLAHKWGIRSAIPSTHPFKTFPPSDVNTQDIGFGGKIERNNGITYHVFISSNIFVVYRGQNINYLIVGGGGGGGDSHGGGGGGGGVLSGTFFASINSYSITVGEGGIGANAEFTDTGAVGFNSTPRGTGLKGGNSSIIGGGQSITAFGGGGGGSNDGNPTGTFGSGGGGGGNNHPGVAGTAGQGNSGGSGLSPGAGGGGGAGGAGVAANTGTGGVGTTAHSTTLLAVGYGTRIAVPTSPNTVISGGVAYIASGGGGAASVSPGPGGSGGIGGGGRGDWNNVFISAGTPNTGGGGGGARSFTPTGESCGRPGGSGLVIIWY